MFVVFLTGVYNSMKHHVLYNAKAGHGDSEQKARALSDFYQGDVLFREISEIKDYGEFFASIAPDDTVTICGGDGTLNCFINATDGIDIPNDILYFAIGTGNDFLRDIGKTDAEKPFSVKKYMRNLPTVAINGKSYRFLNNVGFGIDGYCCEVGDRIKATSTKPVNYTAIAIKGLLFHYKPTNATICVDGKTYRYKKVWLAPTMKGRFYGGGMMPTPAQNRMAEDGTLSLLLFYGKGSLPTLIAFPSIFKGEHIKHKSMVAVHEGKDITVTFDKPSTIQIDGETIVGVTSYRAVAKAPVPSAQ